MSNTPPEKESAPDQASRLAGNQHSYPTNEREFSKPHSEELGFYDLLSTLWRGRLLLLAITAVFSVASVCYAVLATEWYRAEVLLTPAEERAVPSLGAQLGGLAALAGVSVGGGDSIEAVATLKSREFARAFIEDSALLWVFFADDWDAEAARWRGEAAEDWPDVRDAIKYFHRNVLTVKEDRQTGLLTLVVEWTDAETTADWANELVRRLNARLRERALREAENNVAYLQSELEQTTVVTLQQTISRLLESELQKLMLARGNEEFAFRVIDRAEAPKIRVRPRRTLIVMIGTIMGGTVALFTLFIVRFFRVQAGDRN